MVLQRELFINFLQTKTYVNPKSFFSLAMNDVQNVISCDTTQHGDLFNSIYAKSQITKQMTSPKQTYFNLFLDNTLVI